MNKFKRNLSIGLIFLWSGAHLSHAQVYKAPPQGVINNVQPANIMFSQDISGSMTSPWGTTHRMYAAAQAMKTMVNTFGTVARFGLIRWNNGYRDDSAGPTIPISSNSFSSNTALLNLVNAYSSNLSLDRNSPLYPRGGTRVDTGGLGYPTTYFNGAGNSLVNSYCSKTLIMVISDGEWSGNLLPVTSPSKEAVAAAAEAAALYSKYGIVTNTIGIRDTALPTTDPIYIDYQTVASAGHGSAPLFVTDPVGLQNAVQQQLTTFLADSFSAVAPMVMPSTAAGPFVVQPTFQYQSVGQWTGYLKAYNVNTSTNAANLQWEFGANLNAVVQARPENRRIWTVIPGIPTPSSSNWSNWSTNNTDLGIRLALNPAWTTTAQDASANLLIQFIQGYDVFDDDSNPATTKRWPLSDVYHFSPLYVGPPAAKLSDDPLNVGIAGYFEANAPGTFATFSANAQSRPQIILAGSNDGQLHAVLGAAYNGVAAGNELWSFVPPPMLDKLINLAPTQVGGTGAASKSQAIYGIDGGITVRDVYINGSWHTYAAFTYGLGARAFTVIDITNTNAPLHVVSVENEYDNVNSIWKNKVWDAQGNLTITSDPSYNYRELGYTTSTPLISFAKNSSGVYAPVLVLGGGSAQSASLVTPNPATPSFVRPDTGNETFIIALDGIKPGSIIRSIAANNPLGIYSATLCPGSNCPVPLNDISVNTEVIEGGSTFRMRGRYGNELFIPNRNGSLQSVDLSSTTSTGINMNISQSANYSPGSSVTIVNDRVISEPMSISNLTSAKVDGYLNLTVGTGDMQYLSITGRSPDNRVYSFQDTESNFMQGNTYSDTNLVDVSTTASACPMPSGFYGWKLPINNLTATTSTGASLSMLYGKVSSKVLQYGGSTVVPIYRPRTDGLCAIGDSAIFLRDTACGYPKQSQGFPGVIIGGVSVYGGSLIMGISGNSGTATYGGFTKTDNLIVGQGVFNSTAGSTINTYGKQRVR
jgi:hypothetical protein